MRSLFYRIMEKSKIRKKKVIAMFLSVFISFSVIFVNTVPASANFFTDAVGSVIDPVVEDGCNYILGVYESVAMYIVEYITNGTITPGFSQYNYVENNIGDIDPARQTQLSVTNSDDQQKIKNNTIVGRIFTFSQDFGAALAFFILIFSLFICLAGRAESIRDNPISLLIKYIGSMFLIWQGWNIIFFAFGIVEKVWANFVIAPGEGIDVISTFTTASQKIQDGNFIMYGMEFPLEIESKLVTVLFQCTVGLVLMTKLLKQVFRLYIECVERSFILSLISLFCPVAFATMVSRGSINIMHSYIRLFLSSLFLLCINFIMMDVFFTVLVNGGWTCGLLNYVCAVAYVKFAVKIDRHIAAMGVNVAQAGTGLLDSIGGCCSGFGRSLNSIANKERNFKAKGQSLQKMGVKTNSPALYNVGTKMVDGFASKPNTQSFVHAMSNSPTKIASQRGQMHATDNNARGFYSVADGLNIAKPTQKEAKRVLEQSGGIENVSHIQNLNGSIGQSHNAASRFALRDSDGNNLAVIDGENVYSNGDWNGQQMLSNETFSSVGIDVDQVMYSASTDDPSVQKYLVTNQSGKIEEYQAVSIASNPEILSREDGYRTKGRNGEDIWLGKKS